MNYKKLIGALLVGAAIYGAYKYGEKKGRGTNETTDELETSDPVKEERNYIQEIIDQINSKPIISKKDRDNLGLLEVKLKQLINKK